MTTIDPNYLPRSVYNSEGQLKISESEAQRISQGNAEKAANMPEAQRQIFLSMLRNVPEGDIDLTNLDKSMARLEAASLALYNLGLMKGNIIDLLARVMIEQAGEQRQNELENRLQAREQAKQELLDQAGKMKQAADEMVKGAITALVIAVVSAVVTIALSAVQIKMASKQLDMAKTGAKDFAKGDIDADELKAVLDQAGAIGGKAQGWGSIGQGINNIANGFGNWGKAEFEAQAKRLEAEGTIDSAQSQYIQGQGDLRKEMQETLNQMIQAIINFIKEMKESEVNMMQSITRG
jgi:hypothetical protein